MRTIIYKVNGENLRGLNSDELDALYQKGIYVCRCTKDFKDFNANEHYLYTEDSIRTDKNGETVPVIVAFHKYDQEPEIVMGWEFKENFIKVGLMERPKKRKYTY